MNGNEDVGLFIRRAKRANEGESSRRSTKDAHKLRCVWLRGPEGLVSSHAYLAVRDELLDDLLERVVRLRRHAESLGHGADCAGLIAFGVQLFEQLGREFVHREWIQRRVVVGSRPSDP